MSMKTTDIWFAAYLRYKEYTLLDFEIISRGRGRYEFDISTEDWKKCKLRFAESETNAIKSHHLALKDLLF